MVVNARVCTLVCVCTGIKDQVMRELDSKLVVIDLVTVHRVHVHVGRLLRVLQGVILSLSLCLFPCLSASRPPSLPPCSPCSRRRERCNFGLWACCCPWFGNSLPFRFGQVISYCTIQSYFNVAGFIASCILTSCA